MAESTVRGPGLFTGAPASLTIRPSAQPGLRFITAAGTIPASLESRTNTPIHPAFAKAGARNTNLAAPGTDRPAVLTTEHLLAACAGLGIWNADLELQGPEVPIDDGSARAFVDLLAAFTASTTDPILLAEPIEVSAGHGSITAQPVPLGQSTTYTYRLDYGPSGPIPPQSASWTLGDRQSFISEVAPARTFSLRAEAEAMAAAGMFKDFSPADLLVIDDDGQPIDNDWRFDNEPARHKLLDLIGDLALLGRPVHANITATRSGHALNHALAEAIAAQINAAQINAAQ